MIIGHGFSKFFFWKFETFHQIPLARLPLFSHTHKFETIIFKRKNAWSIDRITVYFFHIFNSNAHLKCRTKFKAFNEGQYSKHNSDACGVS
ncbi:hypothetical protein BpHYR1_014427 [Brachionus plicatilis]|uniref:Uncharacterized protein n=1 Tax=Brachionus plicatilis TaxID=10195 RepID=A0A3M7SJK7_BRAPC|nr:hypothetical protein BpHYR1_014427 [Brachionus plicatilis]